MFLWIAVWLRRVCNWSGSVSLVTLYYTRLSNQGALASGGQSLGRLEGSTLQMQVCISHKGTSILISYRREQDEGTGAVSVCVGAECVTCVHLCVQPCVCVVCLQETWSPTSWTCRDEAVASSAPSACWIQQLQTLLLLILCYICKSTCVSHIPILKNFYALNFERDAATFPS